VRGPSKVEDPEGQLDGFLTSVVHPPESVPGESHKPQRHSLKNFSEDRTHETKIFNITMPLLQYRTTPEVMKLLYISIIALVLPGVIMGLPSPCGDPNDPCMDSCRNLEINGCQSIQILNSESCPLQFVCGDDDDDEQLPQDGSLIPPPSDEIIVGEPPSACVKLYIYNDLKCRGPAIRVNSFATWIHPGSACYSDATMQHYSVKDQYCDPKTMNYHETVIVGSSTCHLHPWWQGGKKYDYTFTTDSCVQGISLKGCYQGPCDSDDEMGMNDIQVSHASVKL
jgi:hypothetical protein